MNRIPIYRCLLLLMLIASGWLFSGCFLSRQGQTDQIAGRYRITTDFSRDLMTMRGRNRTVVYKNGRQETLLFKSDYKFARIIHYSTERVKDRKLTGSWQLVGYNKIQVQFKGRSGKNPSRENIVEYYQFDPANRQMIRLGPDHKKLAPAWAPYYTFNRL